MIFHFLGLINLYLKYDMARCILYSNVFCSDDSNLAQIKRDSDQDSSHRAKSLDRQSENIPQGEQLYITLIDLQSDVLYDAYHIYLSPDAVYLVVFNVEKCLQDSTAVGGSFWFEFN